MRSSGLWLKVALACGAAVAIVAGCKGSTAGGNAGPGAGAADGGMTSGIESAASGAAAAAADAGQRAAGAMRDAAQTAADAGAQAYGAAKEKVAEGATTAADAARNAAGMAADAGSQAMDAGAAAGSSAMDRAAGMASSAMDGGTATADAGSAAAPANDAQIAAIAHAANAGDILKSKLVKTRSKNAKVKEFANLMIKDHTALDAQAKKLGVTPEDNETSQKLTQGAQDAVEKLTPLKGKEFDTAYVDNEVQSHEKVLKALDEQLIPNAKDAKLKALLQTARAKVKMHLEHAQKLQTSLSK